MSSGWAPGKLEQLRAKTDRQLLVLVKAELEDALRSESSGDYAQAARAYLEVTRLLPLLHNISAFDRARLEAQLERVRAGISEEATSVC